MAAYNRVMKMQSFSEAELAMGAHIQAAEQGAW